jgi:hypothetical protein
VPRCWTTAMGLHRREAPKCLRPCVPMTPLHHLPSPSRGEEPHRVDRSAALGKIHLHAEEGRPAKPPRSLFTAATRAGEPIRRRKGEADEEKKCGGEGKKKWEMGRCLPTGPGRLYLPARVAKPEPAC